MRNRFGHTTMILLWFILTGMTCGSRKWIKYASNQSVEVIPNPINIIDGTIHFEIQIEIPTKQLEKSDSLVYNLRLDNDSYEILKRFSVTSSDQKHSEKVIMKTFFVNRKIDLETDSAKIYLNLVSHSKSRKTISPYLEIGTVINEH